MKLFKIRDVEISHKNMNLKFFMMRINTVRMLMPKKMMR